MFAFDAGLFPLDTFLSFYNNYNTSSNDARFQYCRNPEFKTDMVDVEITEQSHFVNYLNVLQN